MAFTGEFLPDATAPRQATVCDLVSTGPLNRLSVQNAWLLQGKLPACLFDASSHLLALSIRATPKLNMSQNMHGFLNNLLRACSASRHLLAPFIRRP